LQELSLILNWSNALLARPNFGTVSTRVQMTTLQRNQHFSIGLLLEQLIAALDDQDRTQLWDITESIQITATTHGLIDIAKQPHLLHDTLGKMHDGIDVMQMAGELLDLCRATQSTLLQSARAVPLVGSV